MDKFYYFKYASEEEFETIKNKLESLGYNYRDDKDENNYSHIVINTTNKKSGIVPAKMFITTGRDREDKNQVVTIKHFENLVQLSNLPLYKEADLNNIKDRMVNNLIGDTLTMGQITGRKDSKEKAPIYTFCKQFKLAIEQLALRSKLGHDKYEKGDDWENFFRVTNPDYEYGNAEFRHALGIGDDEDETAHLVATAWNTIARLECHLRNK